MGTSKGYKMPTGGNWTPLKNDATDFVQDTGGPQVTAGNLVTDFLRATGGLKGLRTGSGGVAPSTKAGGGGGTRSSAAVGTARNLGGFLARVGEVGLADALRERGLGELVGKSASEIADALLDEFAGPGSTLDNALAREALADLRDEVLEDAESFVEVEERLTKALDDIGIFSLLASFFGHYVFRLFCRNFYEVWLKKVGESKAAKKLSEVKDYIEASLRATLAGRTVTETDWKGVHGVRIAEGILKETLEVFGVMS